MSNEIIRTGDIRSFMMNNISFAIGDSGSVVFKTSLNNEYYRTNNPNIIMNGEAFNFKASSRIEPSGIEKLDIYVDERKKQVLDAINIYSLPVSVQITVASGFIYSGENLYMIGGYSFNGTENKASLTLLGSYFSITGFDETMDMQTI